MTTSHHGRSTRAGKRAKTERPRKPSKIQPILLDRLAHALKAHGVDLKRTDVLQVAAAAFGYHNANEFSAADLVVQQATPLARAVLPSGDEIVVLRDPIANTAYGVEMGFIEQVVGEERREQFGVSPYGHLLDLSRLPDLDLQNLGQAVPPAGMLVHIAICEYRHGSSGYVALTKDDLYRQIADFCSEYWHEVERRAGPMDEYETDKALVEAYYEHNDRETLWVEEATLPSGAPIPVERTRIRMPAPGEEHPVYRGEHYRDFCKLTGQGPSYAEWVAEQVRAQEASLVLAPWMRSSFADLRQNEVVVVNIHYVGGTDLGIQPGQLALVNHVEHAGNGTQVGVKFADGSQVLFDSRDRGGFLPIQRPECAFATEPMSTVWAVWMQARSAATLKAGDRVSFLSDIRVETGRIPKGTEARITEVFVSDGFVNLRFEVGYHKGSFVIAESLTRGVFPLMIEQRAIREAVMHTEEDWREAVAQRATGASYQVWASERRIHAVHRKEKWLTAAQVRGLKPEQDLVIRVHGSGTAYNDERGETYESIYAPGDTVIVDEVIDMHADTTRGGDEGLILHCRTENGIQIVLPLRNGYLPVALPETAPAQAPVAQAGPTLMSGTPVHGPNGETVTAVAIAKEQPLVKDGLVLFRGETDFVQIARYAARDGEPGRWELYPGSAITPDQLRALGRPEIDEEIVFEGVDCHIEAADFPANQPLAAGGIVIFKDQYGETHMCEYDGQNWVIVPAYQLTEAQAAAAEGLI